MPDSPHPDEPVADPPDERMAERLKRHWWRDASGIERRPEAMTAGHPWSVLGYPRWHAPSLAATVDGRMSQPTPQPSPGYSVSKGAPEPKI